VALKAQKKSVRFLNLNFYFCAFLIAGVSVVFFVAHSQSVKVQVIPNHEQKSAYVQAFSETAKLTPVLSCYSAEFLSRYPDTSEVLAKQAKCAEGYLKASILSQKISHTEGSIAEIEMRINSLIATRQYMTDFSRTKMDGVSLVAIPKGEDEAFLLESASNIFMACLNDASQGVTNSVVSAGDRQNDSSPVFNGAPDIAVKKIEETRHNLDELMKKLGSKTDMDMKGTLATVPTLLENQKIANDYFIPITHDELRKNYKNLISGTRYLSSSFFWIPGPKGRDEKTVNWAVKIAAKLIPSLSEVQIPDKLTRLSVTFEHLTFQAWLEESNLYNSVMESINSNIQRYQVLKTGHQNRLNQYRAQLKTLEDSGYNCQ
jgi:hypothetical protein